MATPPNAKLLDSIGKFYTKSTWENFKTATIPEVNPHGPLISTSFLSSSAFVEF